MNSFLKKKKKPNSFGDNSITASGMTSQKNLNKITVFDSQNVTNGGSGGTKQSRASHT